eukprot:418692-Pelagomonas_calceolata.AAC.8
MVADKTHRELFSDFYASLFHAPLESLIAQGVPPVAAQALWAKMSTDIMTGGGAYSNPMEQVRACGTGLGVLACAQKSARVFRPR